MATSAETILNIAVRSAVTVEQACRVIDVIDAMLTAHGASGEQVRVVDLVTSGPQGGLGRHSTEATPAAGIAPAHPSRGPRATAGPWFTEP